MLGFAYGAEGYRHSPTGELLPNARLTPGVVTGDVTKHICVVKWGKDARHVTEATKNQIYHQYGARKQPKVCCEIDHLVPRELGGADEPENLWPQPWKEARMKDRLENALHKDVCAGKVPLAKAQHILKTDWSAEWHRRFDK